MAQSKLPNDLTKYETDFYAWANKQAALLRAGRFDQADAHNIAEEVESMARAEKRELVRRLSALLLNLLKWRFQAAHRSAGREATILNQRLDIADILADSPSLRAGLDGFLATAYRRALIRAQAEIGLSPAAFPAACPWAFEQAMDEAFWPGSSGRVGGILAALRESPLAGSDLDLSRDRRPCHNDEQG